MLGRVGVMGGNVTRTRILQGAAHVFGQKAVTVVTVEDILQAAQVSRRTFYQFFRNSEEVLEALFEVATELLLESVRESVEASTDPWERLQGAISAYLDLQYEVGPLATVLHSEAIRYDSRLAPRRAVTLDALVDIMGESVFEAQGRRLDPLVFRALVLAIEGICIHLRRASRLTKADVERAKRVILPFTKRVLGGPEDDLPPLPLGPPPRQR